MTVSPKMKAVKTAVSWLLLGTMVAGMLFAAVPAASADDGFEEFWFESEQKTDTIPYVVPDCVQEPAADEIYDDWFGVIETNAYEKPINADSGSSAGEIYGNDISKYEGEAETDVLQDGEKPVNIVEDEFPETIPSEEISKIVDVKETVLPACIKDGFTLLGWNTAEDGSGRMYQPGDLFYLPEGDNTLFGIWEKTKDEREKEENVEKTIILLTDSVVSVQNAEGGELDKDDDGKTVCPLDKNGRLVLSISCDDVESKLMVAEGTFENEYFTAGKDAVELETNDTGIYIITVDETSTAVQISAVSGKEQEEQEAGPEDIEPGEINRKVEVISAEKDASIMNGDGSLPEMTENGNALIDVLDGSVSFKVAAAEGKSIAGIEVQLGVKNAENSTDFPPEQDAEGEEAEKQEDKTVFRPAEAKACIAPGEDDVITICVSEDAEAIFVTVEFEETSEKDRNDGQDAESGKDEAPKKSEHEGIDENARSGDTDDEKNEEELIEAVEETEKKEDTGSGAELEKIGSDETADAERSGCESDQHEENGNADEEHDSEAKEIADPIIEAYPDTADATGETAIVPEFDINEEFVEWMANLEADSFERYLEVIEQMTDEEYDRYFCLVKGITNSEEPDNPMEDEPGSGSDGSTEKAAADVDAAIQLSEDSFDDFKAEETLEDDEILRTDADTPIEGTCFENEALDPIAGPAAEGTIGNTGGGEICNYEAYDYIKDRYDLDIDVMSDSELIEALDLIAVGMPEMYTDIVEHMTEAQYSRFALAVQSAELTKPEDIPQDETCFKDSAAESFTESDPDTPADYNITAYDLIIDDLTDEELFQSISDLADYDKFTADDVINHMSDDQYIRYQTILASRTGENKEPSGNVETETAVDTIMPISFDDNRLPVSEEELVLKFDETGSVIIPDRLMFRIIFKDGSVYDAIYTEEKFDISLDEKGYAVFTYTDLINGKTAVRMRTERTADTLGIDLPPCSPADMSGISVQEPFFEQTADTGTAEIVPNPDYTEFNFD